jgi:ribosomal-protein-alanine N-acetyltransferase
MRSSPEPRRTRVEILTPRFALRELTAADVTERYLGWLRDAGVARYIAAAATTRDLDDLREYVTQRVGREDILFLGIFDRASGLHIGNIKYEPVDPAKGYAIMGILIGDAAARGTGVAPEVLRATGAWLKHHRGIREIILGVERENVAAIRAYEKVGYRAAATPYISKPGPDVQTMVWSL